MFLKSNLNKKFIFDSNFFRIIKLVPIIRDSNYTGSLVPLDFTDAVFTDICLVQLLCTNSLYHAFSYNLATFLMGIWLIQIFPLHKKTREPRTGCMYLWGCFFLSTNYSNIQSKIFNCWFNRLKLGCWSLSLESMCNMSLVPYACDVDLSPLKSVIIQRFVTFFLYPHLQRYYVFCTV